jgi:hypothetical protein
MYITNDLSSDFSAKLAQEYATKDSRIHVINNESKLYQVGNYMNVLELTRNQWAIEETIFVELDGDDSFLNEHVLTILTETYRHKPETLMSHGSFLFDDGVFIKEDLAKRFNRPVVDTKTLRSEKMFIMHLRTWRPELQDQLRRNELINPETDNYWSTGGDGCFFIPMAEMSGVKRIAFIPTPLVLYNVHNPINDFKVDYDLQKRLQGMMNDNPPYEELPEDFANGYIDHLWNE